MRKRKNWHNKQENKEKKEHKKVKIHEKKERKVKAIIDRETGIKEKAWTPPPRSFYSCTPVPCKQRRQDRSGFCWKAGRPTAGKAKHPSWGPQPGGAASELCSGSCEACFLNRISKGGDTGAQCWDWQTCNSKQKRRNLHLEDPRIYINGLNTHIVFLGFFGPRIKSPEVFRTPVTVKQAELLQISKTLLFIAFLCISTAFQAILP